MAESVDFSSVDSVVTSDSDDGITATVDVHTYGDQDWHPLYNEQDDALDKRAIQDDSSDDVDPRRLVREPTASEIRWYYRNTELGPPLVDKPVNDAFKHGFTIENDPTNKVQEFLDGYVPFLKQAQKKARRDGFSVLFWTLRDSANTSRPPEGVRSVEGWNVITLDHLNGDHLTERSVEKFVDYDEDQLRILEQGPVVVNDISSLDHGDIVGYVYVGPSQDDPDENETFNARFIHADRTQHFVHNPEVDGPTNVEWWGHVTGHPILGPCFQALKALSKTNWALGQTMYRYTAPLHVVETPENRGVDKDHIKALNKQLQNLNSASSITLPPGHEMDVPDGGDEIDPEPFVEALISQVCAATEMTKSVLMGTQTGTVSGSETDIRNYFNQVERDRHGIYETKMSEAVRMQFQFDQTEIPSFALGYTIDWEPLFKLDSLDRFEGMSRVVQAVTQGVSNYIISLEDAQTIVQEAWADVDVDADLEFPDEEAMDILDRINISQQGTNLGPQEAEVEGNPRVGQNEGGMEQGEQTAAQNPASGSQ